MKKIDFFTTNYHDYSVFVNNEDDENLNPRKLYSSFYLFAIDKINNTITDKDIEKNIDDLLSIFKEDAEYNNLSSITDKILFLTKKNFFIRAIYIFNDPKITVKCDLDDNFNKIENFEKFFAGFLVSCKNELSMSDNEIEEYKKQIQNELDDYNAYLNGEVYSIFDEDKEDFLYYFIYGDKKLKEVIDKIKSDAINKKPEPYVVEKRVFNKIVPAFGMVTSGIACYNALRHAERMFFNRAFRLDDYRFYKNEDFTILVNNNGVLEKQKVSKIIKGCIYVNDLSKPVDFKQIEFGELFKLYDLIFNNDLKEY